MANSATTISSNTNLHTFHLHTFHIRKQLQRFTHISLISVPVLKIFSQFLYSCTHELPAGKKGSSKPDLNIN